MAVITLQCFLLRDVRDIWWWIAWCMFLHVEEYDQIVSIHRIPLVFCFVLNQQIHQWWNSGTVTVLRPWAIELPFWCSGLGVCTSAILSLRCWQEAPTPNTVKMDQIPNPNLLFLWKFEGLKLCQTWNASTHILPMLSVWCEQPTLYILFIILEKGQCNTLYKLNLYIQIQLVRTSSEIFCIDSVFVGDYRWG